MEWVAYPFSRDLPNPGIKPGSPALPVDSLPTELAKSPIYVTCSFEPKIQVEAALSKYPEPGHGHQGQSVLLWGRATALAQTWGLWGD